MKPSLSARSPGTSRLPRRCLITEAVRGYVAEKGRARLTQRLKEGAIQRPDRHLRLAEEWLDLGCDHLSVETTGNLSTAGPLAPDRGNGI